MAMIRPQRLWMLFLYAGAVLAAATVATTALDPQEPGAPVAAVDAKADLAKGVVFCPLPTSIAVEAVSGSQNGWSYFPTNAPLTLGGAVTYFCNGQPYTGPSAQFSMAVLCDGNALPVGYEDFVTDSWNAGFTAPSAESVCSLQMRAETEGGAVAVVNETLVFMADTEQRPTVTLTSPQAGVLTYPDTVQLAAEASVAAPATITKVEFYDQAGPDVGGQIKLGEATAAPYLVSNVALDPAEHWITAVATDSRGYQVVSEPTQVSSRFNLAPVVKVLGPTVGAVFAPSDAITIKANISNEDESGGPLGTLQRVSLFDSDIQLDVMAWRTGPVTHTVAFNWQTAAVGVHQIYVEAEDQRGAITRAGPLTITVADDAPPTVRILTPADGLFQQGLIAIPLSASASDDRTISQIDFTIARWPGTTGAVVLGASVPAASALLRDTWTATATWTPTLPGRYVIRASARNGASRPDVLSDPVEVYVDDGGTANFVPKVRIELPVDGDGVRQNTSMPVTVRAQDGFGESGTIAPSIKQLSLYLDGGTSAAAISAPTATTQNGIKIWTSSISLPIGALAVGTHTLRALATENGTRDPRPDSESPPVTFTVLAAGVNAAPEGSLSLPAGTSQLGVGATTTLSVRARDLNVDGSISQIELFANGERISPASPGLPLTPVVGRTFEATTSMAWTPPASGDYDLFARVTDNAGLSADSPPIKLRVAGVAGNPAPTAALVAPENGAMFELGSGPLTLSALVGDPGASAKGQAGIAWVEFYADATRIGSVSNPSNGVGGTQVDWVWAQPFEAAQALRAKVRDAEGTVTLSEPINLFIIGEPPTITIVSPVTNEPGLVAPETVWAMVHVADDSGVISKVEYFDNGVSAGVSYDEPYDFHYTGLLAGAHQLTAMAWDGAGHSTLSAPVDINVAVNQPPTIAIVSPSSTEPPAQFAEGSDIPIQVDANDPDEGRIAKVEYFRNGALFLTNPKSPYNVVWTGAQPGLATLTAKATDIRDGVGLTPTATIINVVAARPPVVALTAPAPGSNIFVGDTVTVSANASDPDQNLAGGGHIESVQFFLRPAGSPAGTTGTALAARDMQSPYTLSWQPIAAQVGAGQEIYARAIDTGPAGKNTTDSAAWPVSVLQNHAPTSVTLLQPAMPSHHATQPVAQTIIAPNGILHVKASTADTENNVEKVEFFLSDDTSNSRQLVTTVNRTTTNQNLFEGDVQLLPEWIAPNSSIIYVHAKATDSRGGTVQTEKEFDNNQTALPFSCGGAYGPCKNIATPIAVVGPDQLTTPCNVGPSGAGPCVPTRYAIHSTGVTHIQAERYDQGGHGVGYFEREAFAYSDAFNPYNARLDDVELENCDAHLSPEVGLPAGCVVGKVDDGETLRYSVTMTADSLALVRQMRIWMPKPVTNLTCPTEGAVGPPDPAFGRLEADVVSGFVPNGTSIEFYVDAGYVGSAAVNSSGHGSIPWRKPAGPHVIQAKTVVEAPGSNVSIEGELTPPVTVNLVAGAQPYTCPAGAVATVTMEEAFGRLDVRQASGQAIDAAATCTPTTPVKESTDPNDHWYIATLCPVTLPQGDYWLNYTSPQDGIKLDWFKLSTEAGALSPPAAELQSPQAGARFAINTPVTLTANVLGAIEGQTGVQFTITPPANTGQPQILLNTGHNGTAYWVEHSFSAIGIYTIVVQATMNGVLQGNPSPPVSIEILNAITNQPPTVALTNPNPSAAAPTIAVGESFQLSMTVTDDGAILPGSTKFLLLKDNTAPPQEIAATGSGSVYSANWTPDTAGSYTVTAQASDDSFQVGTSLSGTVIVQGGTVTPPVPHDTPAVIPATIDPRSDGVGATAGEFRVDESGAATYNIPILAVPGRAGVQPQVSLGYSSQSGNGPMGRGWSVSGSSSITRCRAAYEHGNAAAADGSPPIDFSARDQFCLDGQKLQWVAGEHGGNAEYRTEIDGIARVRSFRVGSNDGPNYFVVQRKDGTTSWYGDRVSSAGLPFMLPIDQPRADAYLPRNDGSGLNEPQAGQPAINWAINRSMDSSGNYLDYRYLIDKKIGQQLLQQVDYTGKTRLNGQPASPGDLPPFASIRLNYTPLNAVDWARSFQAGMLTQQTQSLASIDSLVGADIVRQYRLSYNAAVAGVSDFTLAQLQECANGDTGASAVCYRPTTFEWTQAAAKLTNQLQRDDVNAKDHFAPRLGDIDGDGLLDMVWIENNPCVPFGDRQRVWVQYAGIESPKLVMERRGQAPTCSPRKVFGGSSGNPGRKEITDSWLLFDYNGDGRDDLLVADDVVTTNARWHGYASRGAVATGTAFDTSFDLLPSCAADMDHCVPVSSHGGLAQAADINGDGLMDLLFGEDTAPGDIFDKLSVKLAERSGNGYRFSATMDVAADWKPRLNREITCATLVNTVINMLNGTEEKFEGCSSTLELSSSDYGRSPRVLEVDGDGRADLLLRVAYRSQARLNTGQCLPDPTVNAVADSSLRLGNDSATEQAALSARDQATDGTITICDLGSQTRQFFYEMAVDRIVPADATHPRATVWLREYGRQLQSNVRVSTTSPLNEHDFTSTTHLGDLNGDGLQELILVRCKLGSTNCDEAGDVLVVFDNNGKQLPELGNRNVSSFVSGTTPYEGLDYLQVLDYNGDGRADLLFPQGISDASNHQYAARYARADGSFGTETCAAMTPNPNLVNCTGMGRDNPANWITFFADIDGDNLVDFFAWQGANQNGAGGSSLNFRSARSPSRTGPTAQFTSYRPRDMLQTIVNGYGASTRISYEPMTNGAVYRKGFDARNTLLSGNGSPVLDVLAPMYLVSKVESDAPSLDDDTATSAIYYQYQGARMQSGGRGLLGFSEIRTIDPNFLNEHYVTITAYNQEFPYIGLPMETRKYRVASPYAPSVCVSTGPDAIPATCLVAANAVNPFFGEPAFATSSSRLIDFARNRLTDRLTMDAPGIADAHFPYIAASFEMAANTEDTGAQVAAVAITGTFTKHNALADAEYSDIVVMRASRTFGNLSDLRNYADSITWAWNGTDDAMGQRACAVTSAVCVKRTRTHAVYRDAPVGEIDYWRLGRLQRSEVTQWRYNATGQPVNAGGAVRVSAFEYDMASAAKTGLLSAEIVEPEGDASSFLRTAHFYDEFGNSTVKLLCNSDVAPGDCDDPNDYLKVLQRPVGLGDAPLSRIHRYTRTDYDADRRFPVKTWQPYFNGATTGTQAEERNLTVVRARDKLGNVVEALDNTGLWSRARVGLLGRAQGGSTQVVAGAPPPVGGTPSFAVASTLTEFHWCTGKNSGQVEAPCPARAVFRQTSYAQGGARSVAFYDKLGRVFFGIRENMNGDLAQPNAWSGQATRYDKRGRPTSVAEPFFVGGVTVAGLRPDPTGTPWSAQPYWTKTTYDTFDRPTRVELPEHTTSAPAFTGIAYSGLTTTTSVTVFRDDDGDGSKASVTMQSTELKDATGKVVTVTDHDGLLTTYQYDDLDNLTRVSRNAGTGAIDSLISYDALGRKTEQQDPDAGTVRYFYNAAGENVCSVNARNMVSITDYDAQGRAWRKQARPGVGATPCQLTGGAVVSATNVTPPATGQPRSIDATVFDLGVPPGAIRKIERQQTRDQDGQPYAGLDTYSQELQYDNLARPWITTTRLTLPTGAIETYAESTTYDALGRVAVTGDVTGGKVENMYTAHGFLRRLRQENSGTVYWEAQQVDARGQMLREFRHSNAITTRHAYNSANGRLQSILTGPDTNNTGVVNPVQNLAYDFDALGNLLMRSDQRLQLQESFQYDGLNRLLSGQVKSLASGQTLHQSIGLSYDQLGNICTKTVRGFVEQYRYDGRAGCAGSGANALASPHAVKSRTVANGTLNYAYDAAGNQVSAGGVSGAENRTIRFNAEGLADKVNSGSNLAQTSEYRYGPTGRYLRIDNDGAGLTTTTRYLGSVEWISKSSSSQWRERRRSIGGFLILTDTINEAGQNQALKYRYQLGDHFGSIDTLVDEHGTVVERMSFDAHGNRRDAYTWSDAPVAPTVPANTTRGFTGHEHIDAANIVHMNGRLYDPALGRMLSADPIVQEPLNAQNLNRYSYVLNNPLSFTDPTGLSFFSKYWRTIVSVALTAFVPALAPAAWSNLAVAAATGFVSGVITSGTLKGGLFGAFSAVLFYGIGQHFDGLASQSGGFFGSGLSTGQFAGKVLSHALAGGIMNRLQGGKFGDGFASAGVTQALSPAIGKVNSSNRGFSPQRVVVAAMVGGTASAVSGGKFANGAVTAAFSRAFNDEASKKRAFDELQERANAIVDQVRDSFFADKSSPVNIEWRDFQTVVQADFELARSLGLKDMPDEAFGPFAREGTGDSRFGHSALFGAKYNFVNAPAPFSGVQNGSDVNYYYQGIIWAAHGASNETLHRAIEVHNLLDAAKAGSWSESFRNLDQINSVKRFADWGYNYRGGRK